MEVIGVQTATTFLMGRREGGGPRRVGPLDVPDATRDFAVGAKSGKVYESCGRCEPTWSGSVRHYGHVFDGVCFECGGRGFTRVYATVEEAEKVLARRAKAREAAARRRERKAAAEAAARAAEHAAWRAQHLDLALDLETLAALFGDEPEPGPLYDLAFRAAREPLTEAQTAFAATLIAERTAARAAEAARKAAERFAGEVGERVTVTGRVDKAIYIEPQSYGWSSSMLIVVTGTGDDAGITVKTFTSARWAYDVEEGEEITLTGTVKAHEPYQGVAQTTLTRPKRENR